jgi:mannose-6-phosphate isomerase-like protein (cupin superfamily)
MENLPHYEKDIRPWGQFERFTKDEKSTVKLLVVNPGEKLSLQTHEKRDEFWRVISGYGTLTVGNSAKEAHAGEDFYIEKGVEHRIEAGKEGITVLEIAFGDFDEADIKRIDDIYGR